MDKETEKRYDQILKTDYQRLQEIEGKRDFYKKKIQNLTNDEKQESEEFLSYVIMRGITDDLKEFLHLLSIKGKPRYQNFIIRNITEHVIEYMYLMTNKQLIPEYFGKAMQIDLEEDIDMENIAQAYRNLGKNRYEHKRSSVIEMCKSVSEDCAKDGIPCLYDVFSIVSENCHNSYFQEVIDEWSSDEIESNVFNLWLVSLVLVKLLEFADEHQI